MSRIIALSLLISGAGGLITLLVVLYCIRASDDNQGAPTP